MPANLCLVVDAAKGKTKGKFPTEGGREEAKEDESVFLVSSVQCTCADDTEHG